MLATTAVLGLLAFALTIREWITTRVAPHEAVWDHNARSYYRAASADGAFVLEHREPLGLVVPTTDRVVAESRQRVRRLVYVPFWAAAAASLAPATTYVVRRRKRSAGEDAR